MGKLVQIKTKETAASVDDFISTAVADEQKQKDCLAIKKMMEKATKSKAKLWGSAIVGFGNLIYESPKTGRQVEWFKIGFSPRKANITLYLMGLQKHNEALKKLGKHKVSGGCLHINKLEQVDVKVLEKIITAAAK